MDEFEGYEVEFRRLTGQVQRQLTDISTDSRLVGERKKTAIHDTERVLNEANRTYQQMVAESRRHPEMAFEMQPKLRRCDTELQNLQKDVNRAKMSIGGGSDRNALLGGGGNDDELQLWSMNQREKLLGGVDTLGNASASIERSHAVTEETNELAVNIRQELGGQREQLENARDNLYVIDENMSKSKKLVRQMYYKVISNKLLLLAIIVCEIIALLLVIYFKFLKGLF